MITKIEVSELDQKALDEITFDSSELINDYYDYSKVIVKKPWGQEYLIFENDDVAIWILQIKKGAQTSMHCHPHKKTSLVVLEGNVVCSTLERSYQKGSNGGVMIPKSVFHQTSVSRDQEEDAWVMEIESPVNKRDLLRLKDLYGRVGMGYEKKKYYSTKLQNYNYLSLKSSKAYHNFQKRFENSTLELKIIVNQEQLSSIQQFDDEDVICLLKGKLVTEEGETIIAVGDTISVSNFKKYPKLIFNESFEILVVKKMNNTWKASDYLVNVLKSKDITNFFTVPGDSNVHILDSLGKDLDINYFSCLSERSGALAAEAYSKTKNDIGVLVISSGGCGPNSLQGVSNAWIDSTPLLVISGQARSDQAFDGKTRQLGNKALDIISIVKPITKYAAVITDPTTLRFHIEKAVYMAKEGRPGPVWLDIPIDIQGALIEANQQARFIPPPQSKLNESKLEDLGRELTQLLQESKRPVLLVGNGVHLSHAEDELLKLIETLKIPVLTTRKGADLISADNEYLFGRSGVFGQRKSNFIIQNADLVVGIGTRFSIAQIGRATELFAREAKKVMIDIDENELNKETLNIDLKIHSDCKVFLNSFLENNLNRAYQKDDWLEKCRHWSTVFSPENEGYEHKGKISSYLFLKQFANYLKGNEFLCVDGCTLMNTFMHIFSFKSGQRMIGSTGIEMQGFSLPGSIGVAVASERPVFCFTELHGFSTNSFELQTIVENKLPIKIIIFQNRGSSHIKKIQEDHFGSRYVGTDEKIKYLDLDIQKIAEAYKLPFLKITNQEQFHLVQEKIILSDGPIICEIETDPSQELIPRVGFEIEDNGRWVQRPLEDMYPYLDRELIKQEMLIKTIGEQID